MSQPGIIQIQDKTYYATVFKIVDKDPDGIPRQLVMVRDDETVNLKGGEEFLIAYVNSKMLGKESRP